jgi:hypothetical protein
MESLPMPHQAEPSKYLPWEKQHTISYTSWFQSCLCKSSDQQVSTTHYVWLPHPSLEHPVLLLGRLNTPPPPNKTEKHKQFIITNHWQWGWGRTLNQPQKMGLCKEPNSQHVEEGWGTKVECRSRETSQPPRMGAWQTTELVSWD